MLLGTVPHAAGQEFEWPSYGADKAGSKYTPLDQIDKDTVHDVEIAWRQSTVPDAIREGSTNQPSPESQNTPLMADGLLYVSTGLAVVTALDPTTGGGRVVRDLADQRRRRPAVVGLHRQHQHVGMAEW